MSAVRIVSKCIGAISSLSEMLIKMPSSEEEREVAKRKFYQMNRFPNTIGAVDGTHVEIQSIGGEDAEVYRNRKGFFSKNVQVVGGPDMQIMDIVTRWPGSTHDQTMFDHSRLCARFEAGEFGQDSLIGDKGYECRNYLITPLRNPHSPEEILFNESLIRTRQIIERLFGILKRRFPILNLGIRTSLNNTWKADLIIISCAVLHNLCMMENEPMDFGEPELPEVPPIEELDERIVFIGQDRLRFRQEIIEYFATLLNPNEAV